MIELKKLTLADVPLVKKYFEEEKSRNCDYTAGCLFMWRDYYDCGYAVVNDTLILSSLYEDILYFYYPVGKDPCTACREICEYCKTKDIPVILCTLDDRQFDCVKPYLDSYTAYAEREWFDYIYDAQELKNLTGKKNAARRNHIHRFTRLYPDWSYKPIEESDLPGILSFLKSFRFNSEKEDESAYLELDACAEVLENFDAYGMNGGVLKVGEEIVGFTAGETVGDTLFVHIEKANVKYDGVYQMLSYQYLLQTVDDNLKYVNREDDSGDPGLRKSKLSYHPAFLLKKTNVFIGE